MQKNKMSVLVLLLVLIVAIGPVSAANYADIYPYMSNAQIQGNISTVSSGGTVYFHNNGTGIYNGISLNITKPLKLRSVGGLTVLNGITTGSVFNVSNTAGVNITGFTINGGIYGINLTNVNSSSVTSNTIANATSYGINIADSGNVTNPNNLLISNNKFISTNAIYVIGSGIKITNNYMDMESNTKKAIGGYNVFSALIQNNTMLNGGDAININTYYKNLTINNNTINNMTNKHGDGISLVNCNANNETDTSSTITNNIVNNTLYGIFLGGNFKGNVSYNIVDNAQTVGMNITGKEPAYNGSLTANITYNNITNTPIGIEMENPCVINLLLDSNIIGGTSYSIQTNGSFAYPNPHTITVTHNNLVNIVSQAFINATTAASNNTGIGAYTVWFTSLHFFFYFLKNICR